MIDQIINSQSERIDFELHEADTPIDENHILLIGHGVTGNKDRDWAVALADSLAHAGINALRFSFAGNGDSEGAFRHATITKETADLGSIIDTLEALGYTNIGYAGHSMGGAVGYMRASSDERLRHLIPIAAMVECKRFVEEEFGTLTPGKANMWDDVDCPLSARFVDDLTAINSLLPQVAKVTIPTLVIHGSEDELVPVSESEEALDAIKGDKDFVEIEGADHVFEGFEEQLSEAIIDWVSAILEDSMQAA